MALLYTTAAGLLHKMSHRQIFQLTTEKSSPVASVEGDVEGAVLYADGQITDATESEKLIGDAILEALLWAESRVNSYAGRRYDVPVRMEDGSSPREVTEAALSLARYRLFGRRTHMPDDIQDDYEETMAWLLFLSNGKAVLTLSFRSSGPDSSGGRVGDVSRRNVQFNSNNLF